MRDLHATHNAFIQRFFTLLTKPNGGLTAYAIDEFGLAVPLVVVLFAVGFWLERERTEPGVARVQVVEG